MTHSARDAFLKLLSQFQKREEGQIILNHARKGFILGEIGSENAHSNLFPKRDRAKDVSPFFRFSLRWARPLGNYPSLYEKALFGSRWFFKKRSNHTQTEHREYIYKKTIPIWKTVLSILLRHLMFMTVVSWITIDKSVALGHLLQSILTSSMIIGVDFTSAFLRMSTDSIILNAANRTRYCISCE